MLLAVAMLASCAHGPDVPPWLVLRVGTQARLAPSNEFESERTPISPSAAAAHAERAAAADHAAAGDLVTVTQIDGRGADGKHAVAVADAHGPLGWVLAEDVLLPVPPAGTHLIVGATAGGSAQLLFTEQDDDDGLPFSTASHVTYEGFSNDPGNPEYLVHVDDGPLAGYIGYVLADELETAETNAFRFVLDGR